jgi:hypothetical protein
VLKNAIAKYAKKSLCNVCAFQGTAGSIGRGVLECVVAHFQFDRKSQAKQSKE